MWKIISKIDQITKLKFTPDKETIHTYTVTIKNIFNQFVVHTVYRASNVTFLLNQDVNILTKKCFVPN